MSDHKKVSIVIPTFNRASQVRRAIDTSLAQTYECEIIVVDHGSSDETQEVMKEYVGRVDYIRKEEDFGPVFCWLDGVLHASGEFIHIQYDDDWIEEDFIEKTVNLMGKDVGLAFSDAAIIDLATDRQIDEVMPFLSSISQSGVYDVSVLEKYLVFSGHKLISPGACLFRKNEVIDALYLGKIPICKRDVYHGVGADLMMSLLPLLRFPKFAYIQEPLASFGSHNDSITIDAMSNKERHDSLIAAYNEVRLFYISQKELKGMYSKYWDRYILNKTLKKRIRRILGRIKRIVF